MNLCYQGAFRYISHPKMDGPWNMAVDEALSIHVTAGPPILRIYGFSPPALSVGRFQKTKNSIFFQKLAEDGTHFVRRPTGGQAVLHDNKVTYALILSKKHVTEFRKRKLYRFVSERLVEGLELLGIPATFSASRVGGAGDPDCFATTSQFEVVSSAGKKIIGSAQYTTRSACLQHGSIQLGSPSHSLNRYLRGLPAPRSDADKPYTCAEAELGHPVEFAQAAEMFHRAFKTVLCMEPSELRQAELDMAAELLAHKYSNADWNRRI